MGEVDGSSGAVAAEPGHWAVMTLEDLRDARLTVTHAGAQLKISGPQSASQAFLQGQI